MMNGETHLKRIHVLLGILVIIVGSAINIGWNYHKLNILQEEYVLVKKKIQEIEIKQESLIEIKVDINYIKRDIAEIKQSVKRK